MDGSKNSSPLLEVPPEVWYHVLQYINGTYDVLNMRRVNRIFNNELKKKNPLAALKDIKIPGI